MTSIWQWLNTLPKEANESFYTDQTPLWYISRILISVAIVTTLVIIPNSKWFKKWVKKGIRNNIRKLK